MHFIRNFCKNTIFFSIITSIFLQFAWDNSFGTEIGSPYIQRIYLKNYGIINTNFSLVQDKYGLLYIANTNGIVQYDGTFWDLISTNSTPVIAINDSNVIYAGMYNDFGFLSTDKYNKSTFISLLHVNFKINNPVGQIKKIIPNKNEVFFCSGKVLYNWDGKNTTIVDSSTTSVNIFKIDESIYLYMPEKGLLKLLGGKFESLPNSEFFKNKNVIDILPYNQQLLVKTKNEKRFYLFDNFIVQPFETKADEFIYKNIYSCSCTLNNGNYAIGTQLNGILVIDKKGEIISQINVSAGLLNKSVNNLFVDKENNLWALHNLGISRIETPSAFNYFNTSDGLSGNITDVIRFKKTLYVATSTGVYSLNEKNSGSSDKRIIHEFLPVSNINSESFAFHVFENRLFVSTRKGIFEISGNKSSLFFNKSNEITCILHSKNHPDILFIGTDNGISAVRYINGLIISLEKIKGIKNSITSMAEDADGTIWLSCKHKEIYRIYPFDFYNSNLIFDIYTPEIFSPQKIDWIVLFEIKNNVLFSTSEGLYRYNKKESRFTKELVSGTYLSMESCWFYPVAEDKNKNMWFNVIDKKELKNRTFVKYQDKDSVQLFSPLPISRLKNFMVTSIHPDDSGIVWIGGFERLIRFDTMAEQNVSNGSKTLIHSVTAVNDTLIANLDIINSPGFAFGQNRIQTLPYNQNTIKFEFSLPDYRSEDLIQYRVKLDGFDTTWSNWSLKSYKEYTNLYEGKYIFKVQAKDIFDNITTETEYPFIIKPPFYRTGVAYLIYLFFIFFITVLGIKWRAYYFAKERFKLENIINERTEEVVLQKEKADNLLERVLPKTTAKELKSGHKAGPYHYNMVTVLFSDIQGFTKISEQLDSEMLIDELDKFFLKFDSVVDKYNIEKIKTIGDAYMCAGGIPEKNRTNPVEVVLAAMEMQNYMKTLKHEKGDGTKRIWDLRIGVDTGPVVAGVLGRSKISYDIWGGTVNTASRIYAAGEPGKVNVTENTFMMIKEFFICQYRGKMPVKYKGEIDMYFVEGFMPHLSSDIKGLCPNETFFTQLQLLRLNDLEEFVLSKLEEGLPDNLYYHNVKHTIDVVTQVELIGRSEKISDEDMLVLKTAALFHDTGHMINYDTHEEESVKLARKILPGYHYSEKQIERISKLILCTRMSDQPSSLLEEIMCDADLDYLGRTDFVPVSINLFKELNERKKIDSLQEWNNHQIKFIQNHQYFTQTARKLREVNKKNQLENIRAEMRRIIVNEDE